MKIDPAHRRHAAVVAAVVLLAAVAALVGLAVRADAGMDSGAAAEASQADAANDRQALPQIRIGTDDLEPFTYIDRDGERTGMDAQIAIEACRRAGLEPVFVSMPWGEQDEYLEQGLVDCIWCGFARDGLEDDYLWSDAYLAVGIAAVVRADDPAQSLADLGEGRTIAFRSNSIADRLLLGKGLLPESASVLSFGTTSLAKAAFTKGYADALITHRIILDQLMADYPGAYRYLGGDLATAHLAVAFRRGYVGPYYRQINDALASMKRDGTIAAISERYTQAAFQPEEARDAS